MVHEDLLTDLQIAESIPGATVKRVQSWRRRFGIQAVPRWARNQTAPLEGKLRSLLVGSMLGDGRLVRHPHSTYYSESHAGNQRAYLEWKVRLWEGWDVRVEDIPDKRGYEQVRMRTCAHALLNPWHELFYPGVKGWKRLVPEVVDHIDEFALAIWYLDDGSVGWWPDITFGADVKSREVAFAVFEKFGLAPRWDLKKGNTGVFHMEREETAERFLDLIRPHVPDCMEYKLGAFGFQGPHHQLRKRLTREELVSHAAQGVPIKQIARDLGVGATTVSRRLREWGIRHPRRVGRPPVQMG